MALAAIQVCHKEEADGYLKKIDDKLLLLFNLLTAVVLNTIINII